MTCRQYHELEGFEEIYLEDSWVLGFKMAENGIEFLVDCVLTEKHPLYTPRKENEQYCYCKARIVFPEAKSAIWHELNWTKARAIDLNGTIDYDNIDSFYEEDGAYHLEGSWGQVSIVSDVPQIHLETTASESAT